MTEDRITNWMNRTVFVKDPALMDYYRQQTLKAPKGVKILREKALQGLVLRHLQREMQGAA